MASDSAAELALKKHLRGDLDAILNKALKKQTDQRYPTVAAFADDFSRHLGQRPVLAQPDRLWYRFRKLVSRYRFQAAASVLVVSALIVGAGLALWQAQQARQQARRAEEVKQFILSIFRDADSDAGSSRKTSAVDLLKQARLRLAASPVSDPATRAEVLTAVGYSMIGQGEHAQARQVLDEALELARNELGMSHAATADVNLKLGELLVTQEKFAEAVPLLDAVEIEMRRLGNMPGLVAALRWKSHLQSHTGRFEEAIILAREALSIAETQLASSDKQELLNAYRSLSNALTVVARPGGAEAANKAYVLARELHGGRPTPLVLSARSEYAYALINEGQSTQGIAELKALLVQQAELFGANHVSVAFSHQRIGLASLATGDPLTAIDSFEAAVRIARADSGGRPTQELALQHLNLGGALSDARRLAAAEREFRQAVTTFDAVPDANPAYARLARSNLAMLLARTHRLAEGDKLLASAMQQPFAHPLEAASMKLRLGALRSLQGRHAEAIELLTSSTAELTAASAPIYYQANALSALGAAQLEAGQAQQALETLEKARSLYERAHAQGSPASAAVQTYLARAQLASGQVQQAISTHEKALAFWRTFHAAGRDFGLALLWQARALGAAGHHEQARDALRHASEVLAVSGLPRDGDLLDAARRSLHTPALDSPSRTTRR